ncbi:MAG TPA: hypothetical protein DEB39_01140 [Planctomycetaceae bacterium]|nr:hypothetical protein [Planctomycetaceae bacterium]
MISGISSITNNYAAQSRTPVRESQGEARTAVLKASGIDMNDTLELSNGMKTKRDKAETASGTAANGTTAVREPLPKGRELTEEDKKFREVMHRFVGEVLFGQMLKSMRASQEPDPIFGRSNAEEMFQQQLDVTYVEKMTNSSSNSLSDAMFNQMQRFLGKAEV